MRIAQVAPLFERVPPNAYGGTERIVSYLTEGLVARGHDVTLFASGDSETAARLVPGCERALRGTELEPYWVHYHTCMLDEVCARSADFDLIHFHCDTLQLPLARRLATPSVTTTHGRLDIPAIAHCLRHFAGHAYVAISEDQRGSRPELAWRGTVHHGLPHDLHTAVEAPGEYLAFLGRMSAEKGCLFAVEIARRAGMNVRFAGKLDQNERPYWGQHVLPLFERGEVEYIGEIGGAAKDRFLGGARALLFPIDWPEPFGLVMIEAMACGTPVIAFRRGAVPEVIEDGVTGFIVDDVAGAAAAVARLGELDRRTIRQRFEARFTVDLMIDKYVMLYRELTDHGAHHARDAVRNIGGNGRRAAAPA
ncbi:MAG: glycosyltransferase family 4 protein [Kofleriaceae bacterium]|nr:MAG: glycosyltransferase family 4 protein [Kofleriaceae bacterium]